MVTGKRTLQSQLLAYYDIMSSKAEYAKQVIESLCLPFEQKQTHDLSSVDEVETAEATNDLTPEATGSTLAMWELEIQNIELEKGVGGLGFSILDYQVGKDKTFFSCLEIKPASGYTLFHAAPLQDPLDPAKTVIVIRSLVPNGVAEQDGRLLPGDRLMFVNDINLESASLEDAVQALKGAELGMVQIGVAKPLPVSILIRRLGVLSVFCGHVTFQARSF